MNNREHAILQIQEFLKSDEKGLLMTGTHQYEKHKLVMRILDQQMKNHLILFRTNGMKNISNDDHLGWAGVKKNPKAGERIRIGRNTYECDSSIVSSTWYKTNRQFTCAIVYPIDPLLRSGNLETVEDLFRSKDISKVFLVSWTDHKDRDYSMLSSYFAQHVIYDAEEEDPEYHKRVLDL